MIRHGHCVKPSVRRGGGTLIAFCWPSNWEARGKETVMLVLTRKLGEQVVVPECELTFTILEIHKDKVRVGIAAPIDVKVYRHEVWQRILAEADQEAKAAAAAVP
jgi:carbon storage regulator